MSLEKSLLLKISFIKGNGILKVKLLAYGEYVDMLMRFIKEYIEVFRELVHSANEV